MPHLLGRSHDGDHAGGRGPAHMLSRFPASSHANCCVRNDEGGAGRLPAPPSSRRSGACRQTAPPRPMLLGRMIVSSRPGPTAMNFTRVLVKSAMYCT